MPLRQWLASRRNMIADVLFAEFMLFGEWCYAVHSVRYTKLPNWFLAFDVYDCAAGCLGAWSGATNQRRTSVWTWCRSWAEAASTWGGRIGCSGCHGWQTAPLKVFTSVARARGASSCAKLVRAEFVQAIGDHWSRRAIEVNKLAVGMARR